jgi:hypothetical protein
MDQTGRIVQDLVEPVKGGTLSLDVGHLPAGSYTLQVSMSNGASTGRFIVFREQ